MPFLIHPVLLSGLVARLARTSLRSYWCVNPLPLPQSCWDWEGLRVTSELGPTSSVLSQVLLVLTLLPNEGSAISGGKAPAQA